MTNEESIETIKNMDTSEFGYAVHQALNMAIEALEKQIPIKPIKSRKNWYLCPKCKVEEFMFTNNEKTSDYTKFCSTCGQAFDWSGDEEETEKR